MWDSSGSLCCLWRCRPLTTLKQWFFFYILRNYRVWRFRSSVMLWCANGRVVLDVSNGSCVSIFRLKESKNNSFLFTILRNVGNIRRKTEGHVTEDVNTSVTLVYNSKYCIKFSKINFITICIWPTRCTKCMCGYDIQLIKRLLLKIDWYSPKHVERILKVKSNHKNFVHLVGLYTYCKMMQGAYNVKIFIAFSISVVLWMYVLHTWNRMLAVTLSVQ